MNKSKIIICKYSIILMSKIGEFLARKNITVVSIILIIIITLIILISIYASPTESKITTVDKTSQEKYDDRKQIVPILAWILVGVLSAGIIRIVYTSRKTTGKKEISGTDSSEFICYIWFGLIYSAVIIGIIYFVFKAVGYMKDKTFSKNDLKNESQITDITIKWGDNQQVSLNQSNVDIVKNYIEQKHFTS